MSAPRADPRAAARRGSLGLQLHGHSREQSIMLSGAPPG